jgi:hypothetical protein
MKATLAPGREIAHAARSQFDLTATGGMASCGIVRAITLPKRQNRISRPLIFLHFSGSI